MEDRAGLEHPHDRNRLRDERAPNRGRDQDREGLVANAERRVCERLGLRERVGE
jgi:hypothetical protein